MISTGGVNLLNRKIIIKCFNSRFCQLTTKSINLSEGREKNSRRTRLLEIKSEKLEQERRDFQDTFGKIESFQYKFSRLREDSEDIEEYKKQKLAQGKTIKQYLNEIKAHLANHDYQSALKVLEYDMVNDNKKAVPHIYDVLVAYSAEIGDLKEAYRLYTNLKKRHGQVSGGMYTSLFNACANCQNSFLALEKAKAIRKYLDNDSKISINTTHYNVLLKAFGRHGDLASCFKILDEVLERRDKIQNDTFAFLFQACISDKNSGLRHALLVWRKMLQLRIQPNIYIFNLLLRCVRECSFGEATLINDLVKQIQNESKFFYKLKVKYVTVDGTSKRVVEKIAVDGNSWMSSFKKRTSAKTSKSLEVERSKKNLILGENKKPTDDPSKIQMEAKNNSETLKTYTGETKSAKDNAALLEVSNKQEMESTVLTSSSDTQHNEPEGVESLTDNLMEKITLENAVDIKILEKHSDVNKLETLSDNLLPDGSETNVTMTGMSENISSLEESISKESFSEVEPSLETLENITRQPVTDEKSELPNLLDFKPSVGSVINFGAMTKPCERFMCFGNMKGFLKVMSDFDVQPNVKTFTLLLDVIPNTEEVEKEIFNIMKTYKIKMDTGFCNMVMLRRFKRNDFEGTKQMFDQIKNFKLSPCIRTFGILAMTCQTHQSALEFIELARSHNVRLNVEILGALLINANRVGDLQFVSTILKAAKEDQTQLSSKFIALLRHIVEREKRKRKAKVLEDTKKENPEELRAAE